MAPRTDKTVSKSTEMDSKLIQDYIKNKNKEHCEVIGQDCERCSVTSFCEHKKEKA